MSMDLQPQPPATPPAFGDSSATPTPVAPPTRTSGLAVAGLILAFILAPIGFILSLVAFFKTGSKTGQRGRGLAVSGLVVSLVVMGVITAGIVVVANKAVDKVSTLTDPACNLGKTAMLDNKVVESTPDTIKDALQKSITGLAAAKAEAKHDNVRNAVTALENDYQQLLVAVTTGSMPANLSTKIEADAKAFDDLCTIGAGK